MKKTIAVWGLFGLIIVSFWQVYAIISAPFPISNTPVAWLLARFSCPLLLVAGYLHSGVSIYWVLVTNLVTYAMFGIVVNAISKHRAFRVVRF